MNVRNRIFSVGLALSMLAAGASTLPAQAQSTPAATAAASSASGNFEVFHWWAGAEAPAISALLDVFSKQYPGIKITNSAVAGGAGVNAHAVLKTRMLGGQPPDSFQVHAGWELIGTYAIANTLEPLDDLYKSEGWMDKFPKSLLDLMSYNGHIWSVPLTIHRANLLWYIPANLAKWGITPPKTWDEFLTTCATLKAKDPTVAPLAIGATFLQVQLFENILLATLGPKDYVNLFQGNLKWTDDKVKAAFTMYSKVLNQCVNADYASLGDWVPAAEMVVSGKAAFHLDGDWAAGQFSTNDKLAPKTGFGWALTPGTDGVFDFLSDAFELPKGAPDRDNALLWLKTVGSVAGSDAMNPLKGSISPRLDSDLSKYSVYSQSAAADFKTAIIVPSLEHGAAAPEAFTTPFTDLLTAFNTSGDVDSVTAAAEQLAEQTTPKALASATMAATMAATTTK